MKNIKVILLAAILLVSFISCKDKTPEKISGDSSGAKTESEHDAIKRSFKEQKKYLNEDFVKTFDSSAIKVTEKYVYHGGEIEPAVILFLSSGVMVLNSKIFTKTKSITFFNYEFINKEKLLKIKFVDSKLNFNDYADMENSSSSVFKIDRNDNSIIYHIKNNGFFFFNWGFYKE